MMVLALMKLSLTPSAILILDMGDVSVIIAGSSIAAGIGVAVSVKEHNTKCTTGIVSKTLSLLLCHEIGADTSKGSISVLLVS